MPGCFGKEAQLGSKHLRKSDTPAGIDAPGGRRRLVAEARFAKQEKTRCARWENRMPFRLDKRRLLCHFENSGLGPDAALVMASEARGRRFEAR